MLDPAGFRARYPEFATASDALVSVTLKDASSQIDNSVWGTLTDQAHGLLTAHMLVIAPNGQMARLQTDKGVSTYWTRYVALRDQQTFALRIF